jgi:hypothetical protein
LRRVFTSRPWPPLRDVLSSTALGYFLCFSLAALLGAPIFDLDTAAWAVLAAATVVFPAVSLTGSAFGAASAFGLGPLIAAASAEEEEEEGGVSDTDGDAAAAADEGGASARHEARPLALPAALALCGAWLGAVPLPLDWGTAWQEWPFGSAVGTCAGAALGICALCAARYLRAAGKSARAEV